MNFRNISRTFLPKKNSQTKLDSLVLSESLRVNKGVHSRYFYKTFDLIIFFKIHVQIVLIQRGREREPENFVLNQLLSERQQRLYHQNRQKQTDLRRRRAREMDQT